MDARTRKRLDKQFATSAARVTKESAVSLMRGLRPEEQDRIRLDLSVPKKKTIKR